MTNGRTESESKDEVLSKMKELDMDSSTQSVPKLPETVESPKVLKTIKALLNAVLWLPFKVVDATQFALAPAKALLFDHRKLKSNISLPIESESYLSPYILKYTTIANW